MTKEKKANQANDKKTMKRPVEQVRQGPLAQYEEPDPLALQRVVANPAMAAPVDVLKINRVVGNRAVQRLLARSYGGEAVEQETRLTVKSKEGRKPPPRSNMVTRAGPQTIQREVVSVLHPNEWVREKNESLVAAVGGPNTLDWDDTPPTKLKQADTAVIFGHGEPGHLLDTRKVFDAQGNISAAVPPKYGGEKVGDKIAELWGTKIAELRRVVFWSCEAGAAQGVKDPSLVVKTKQDLMQRGAVRHDIKVSGAEGLHIPDVNAQIRYSKTTIPAEKELFAKLEGHHRYNNYLAKGQPKTETIPSKDLPRSTTDRTVTWAGPDSYLHTWAQIEAEHQRRGKIKNPVITGTKNEDDVNKFYAQFFGDEDIKALLHEKPQGEVSGKGWKAR